LHALLAKVVVSPIHGLNDRAPGHHRVQLPQLRLRYGPGAGRDGGAPEDEAAFRGFLEDLGYDWTDEKDKPAYKFLLA